MLKFLFIEQPMMPLLPSLRLPLLTDPNPNISDMMEGPCSGSSGIYVGRKGTRCRWIKEYRVADQIVLRRQ